MYLYCKPLALPVTMQFQLCLPAWMLKISSCDMINFSITAAAPDDVLS
jgi:hypothetical protein